MSTSPKRAAIEPSPDSPGPALTPFPYAAIDADMVRGGIGVVPDKSSAQHSVDAAARESAMLTQGRLQGQAEARKAFAEQLEKERAALVSALAEFAGDRSTYFQTVEAEVVQLALAIARKILHREAEIDPLLLAAIVRVALDKIDGATRVTLRVHPQNAADWRRYLGTHLDPAALPEIVEDAAQPPEVCTLETSMGKTDIGVELQLKEIESGLLDLLAARPGVGS